MKYNPDFSPMKHFEFESKKQLGRYCELIKYNPDENKYRCTFCDKKFTTESGAYNHIDFEHTQEIMEILKSKQRRVK